MGNIVLVEDCGSRKAKENIIICDFYRFDRTIVIKICFQVIKYIS